MTNESVKRTLMVIGFAVVALLGAPAMSLAQPTPPSADVVPQSVSEQRPNYNVPIARASDEKNLQVTDQTDGAKKQSWWHSIVNWWNARPLWQQIAIIAAVVIILCLLFGSGVAGFFLDLIS